MATACESKPAARPRQTEASVAMDPVCHSLKHTLKSVNTRLSYKLDKIKFANSSQGQVLLVADRLPAQQPLPRGILSIQNSMATSYNNVLFSQVVKNFNCCNNCRVRYKLVHYVV